MVLWEMGKNWSCEAQFLRCKREGGYAVCACRNVVVCRGDLTELILCP